MQIGPNPEHTRTHLVSGTCNTVWESEGKKQGLQLIKFLIKNLLRSSTLSQSSVTYDIFNKKVAIKINILFSVSPATSNEKQAEISFCSGIFFFVREFVTTVNTSSEKVNEKKGCLFACLFVLVSYEHIFIEYALYRQHF